ncbi:MAG: hypothetical protein F6K30_30540 [Cyanothece sp. SIO2G6]|nr:hypothetical protein [Cyanothece sp. SIO2G6]
MDWLHLNRVTYNVGIVVLAAMAVTGSAYMMGYPWTCEQATQARSIAYLRLQRAESEYPPGTPYLQHRQNSKREADTLAKTMCGSIASMSESEHRVSKFFLKYRSDY